MGTSIHQFTLMASASAFLTDHNAVSSLPDQVPDLSRASWSTLKASQTIRRRRQPSEDEWQDLKPVIKTLYIDESMTLRRVSEILRDDYGFFPT
jgi:hypothetical protein